MGDDLSRRAQSRSALWTTLRGTVTGTLWPIPAAALVLPSSQYSPRLLQTSVRDRFVQHCLAELLGTFVYALAVLRSVRSADESGGAAFVPRLSRTVAVREQRLLRALADAVLWLGRRPGDPVAAGTPEGWAWAGRPEDELPVADLGGAVASDLGMHHERGHRRPRQGTAQRWSTSPSARWPRASTTPRPPSTPCPTSPRWWGSRRPGTSAVPGCCVTEQGRDGWRCRTPGRRAAVADQRDRMARRWSDDPSPGRAAEDVQCWTAAVDAALVGGWRPAGG